MLSTAESQPLTNCPPSSINNFFGKPISHENLANANKNCAVSYPSMTLIHVVPVVEQTNTNIQILIVALLLWDEKELYGPHISTCVM